MLVRDPVLRWALFIALMMTLSQQLSGINVAIFYSTKIFTDAGLVGLEAQAATLGMGRLLDCNRTTNSAQNTGALLIAMTFVSVLIIDLFGRRVLHMAGMTVMFFSSILLVVFLVLQSNVGYTLILFYL
jgi:SP family facilitated glucose transporter-like MFS transporter 1